MRHDRLGRAITGAPIANCVRVFASGHRWTEEKRATGLIANGTCGEWTAIFSRSGRTCLRSRGVGESVAAASLCPLAISAVFSRALDDPADLVAELLSSPKNQYDGPTPVRCRAGMWSEYLSAAALAPRGRAPGVRQPLDCARATSPCALHPRKAWMHEDDRLHLAPSVRCCHEPVAARRQLLPHR